MSDKIDEIIDQLIKGGRGSGIRGHKSGPASDIKRKIDPSKKKKILASDRKAVRKEVRGHSDEKLQSAIDSHKELSESQHLSPGSRESYAAKHKVLVSEQKKRNKNKDIESSEREEHGASLRTKFQELSDKWFGKGGPGSGKKGHMGVTPDKTQRERNQQKAGEVRDTGREARKIAAELDLSKDDMKEIRDYASAEGISPSQFIVNNKDHIKTNLKKGGPGSGRKGHKTNKPSGKIEPKHFEPNPNLKYKNYGLDELSPEQIAERKKKKEEAQNQARKERLKERADAAYKRGDKAEYEKLITEVRTKYGYKGDPAAEAVSPTSHGTKPAGEGKYGVEGGKYTDPASEGASAAMSDNRRANTEKYLEQLKTSLSLETDPAAKADFEKDIKDIEAELKIKKSLDTLFYMNQLANQGRIKPKNKRNVRKSLGERLEKKQGVPKGVDPAKHERCVLDVKADGKDKSSAYAICNASMNKAAEVRIPSSTPPPAGEGGDDWWAESVTDKTPEQPAASPSMHKGSPGSGKVEKVLPLAAAAAKTAGRIVQNAVKSPDAGKGSDKVPGGPGGPSAAAGGGTGSGKESGVPKMTKSIGERLMTKGGIGSGRKGHHTFSDDGYEHDSVFEDSRFDNTQEREIFNDKMKAAAEREERKAEQRLREKGSTAKRGISRKAPKAPEKKSFLQRLGQGIIDRI